MRALLLVSLVVVGCGADHKSDKTVMSITLPATFDNNVITSEGAILGDEKCSTVWAKQMSFEDVGGVATLNGIKVNAVEGKPNTWFYIYDRAELEVIETTTFNLSDKQVSVSLSCNHYGPHEGSY